MASGDKAFTGSIPAFYDTYLVPLLFGPYADDLAQRLDGLTGGRVLEIGAGSGVVTRAMARALPAAVEIVATDLNAPMIERAASQLKDRTIEWRVADACALPFDDAAFDVVVCQFAAMFFPDKTAAFREARRVLAPGGRFLFSVWDRIEVNEVSDIALRAVADLFPVDPPSFLARIPHGCFDVAPMRKALLDAGFASVDVEAVERRSVARDARFAAIGLCQGTPLRNEIEARDPARLEEATDAAAAALTAAYGDGVVDGPMRAFVFTAT